MTKDDKDANTTTTTDFVAAADDAVLPVYYAAEEYGATDLLISMPPCAQLSYLPVKALTHCNGVEGGNPADFRCRCYC